MGKTFYLDTPSGDIVGVNNSTGRLGIWRSGATTITFSSREEAANFGAFLQKNYGISEILVVQE